MKDERIAFPQIFLCVLGALCGKSFRDDAMNAFADKENIRDLHVAQVCFGGDVFLQPRT
jgi:hypothetical protein